MARDRARRNPVSRADHGQIRKARAWADARPASTRPDGAPRPNRDRAAQPFLLALILALAATFGAVMGLAGSSALQEALRTMGLGGETAMEAVQRKQAAAISQLDLTVRALNAAVAGLSAHADFAGHREEATSRRMAQIDDDLGALRTSMNEMRAAQSAAAAEEPWRKPVAQLVAAAAKARGEINGLRASLDEFGQTRHPDMVAIGERIDRLEQAMVQHNLIGPIRGSIQDLGPGYRPLASRESSSAAARNGHVTNLMPATQ